jgi:hypothetical protein
MKTVLAGALLLLSFGSAAGCERKLEAAPTQAEASQDESSSAVKPKREETPRDGGTIAEPQGAFRRPAAERVVAIGDLHGDFAATERAFRLAGAIDGEGKWSGGKLVVVQTGDQLDRGDGEREIIEFLERLSGEAKEAGGALVVLNGNHETMNVLGDFRYVTEGALRAFDKFEPAAPLSIQVEGPYKSRAAAFLPGGGAALILAKRPLVVMVGDTIFAHGGVRPEHVDYGIDKLNEESRNWMEGKTTLPPRLVMEEEGPLWTRIYGGPQVSAVACEILQQTLKRLGAARMAVGHTVQEGGMSSACDGRVYRIDVGLAAHYGGKKAQVLEIQGSEARILTEN